MWASRALLFGQRRERFYATPKRSFLFGSYPHSPLTPKFNRIQITRLIKLVCGCEMVLRTTKLGWKRLARQFARVIGENLRSQMTATSEGHPDTPERQRAFVYVAINHRANGTTTARRHGD